MKFVLGMMWLYSVLAAAMYAHEFAYEKAFREARQKFESKGYRFNKTRKAFTSSR